MHHATDFRAVDPRRIQWKARRGPTATPVPGETVVVQTPRCPCQATREKNGAHRVMLRLDPAMPSHAAFAAWMRDTEDAAAEALADWAVGATGIAAGPAGAASGAAASMSRAVFRDSLRLMVFSGTPVFDATDRASADLTIAASAACLMKLRGVWSRNGRWGLSWSVTEVKFEAGGGVSDEEAETDRPAACVFGSANPKRPKP